VKALSEHEAAGHRVSHRIEPGRVNPLRALDRGAERQRDLEHPRARCHRDPATSGPGNVTFAAGDALDYEVVRQTPDALDVNVTGCRYARFYHQLGVPELGFLLVRSSDFAMTEGFGAGVELTRTRTIMQGADHCDFRYSLKKPDPET
jgi:hypothetical protein